MFAVCEADSIFMSKMMPSLLMVFAEQVLNPESVIEEVEEVQRVARVFLCSSTIAVEKRRRNVWKGQKGMCPVQPFPDHITLHIPQSHSDMELYERTRHLQCIVRCEKRLSRLSYMDKRALFS